jgi:hypothetical protein
MNANWIIITEEDVLSVVNESYLSAWRDIATAASQGDPLAATIDTVTLTIRGHCGAKVTLGPAGTIPDVLKSAALDLIKVRLPRRVGLESSPTDLAIEKAAMDLLKAVVSGGFETGATEKAGRVGITIAASAPRTASAEQLEGLL